MSEPDLLALADGLVARARPGEQVEAYCARSRTTTVRAYGGEVESLTEATSAGMGIRVVKDGRQGFAYAGTLDAGVLEETLADARDNAEFGAVDEANGLAEPDGVEAAALDLYRPGQAEVAPTTKVDLALALEKAVQSGDTRIRSVPNATYSDGMGEAALVSTTGLRAWDRSTSCYLSVEALAGEGDDVQTGYGVGVGREVADLDPEAVAAEAIERATRLLGARQPSSRRLTVVLEPSVTAAFLGIISSTLNGEAVLKGRSLFADRVGQVVGAGGLTLVDDATDPRSPGATRYDGEGLACRPTVLIEGGVLRGFLHDTWSARKAGVSSTASAVRGYSSTPSVGAHALAVQPGTLSPEAVLAQVGDGFLVQSVAGLHSGVNAVSGDFSVGAAGLMIRDGVPAEPVREATIASTLQRMLLDVVAVGNDLDWRPGGTGAVTLAIADVSLSGA